MEGRPKLRVDLIARYQRETRGKTRVILEDPVSGKYFQLSEYEYNLLKSLDGTVTLEQAVEKLKRAGNYYSIADARFIMGKAAQLGLLLGTKFGTARFQLYLKNSARTAKRNKMLSSVYFLFIPVLNPDRFLEKTLWFFNLVASKWSGLALALAAPGAIYLIISGYSEIQLEYLFFFNWQNLLLLWLTIALTKLLHEFAHAYTAKGLGLQVPEMGVAFLIFFPCLYCNTTDAWQLANHRQRASIAAAGIMAEAAVAVVSTYIWYFSQPGLINSLAFYLMAVSFISTVLFNGNPLLKFDGYFILIDFLRMPNLALNSLRYIKYLFMNRVMGNELVPNPAQSHKEAWIFAVYGVSSIAYRFFLYTGIVMAAYFRFDKLLGILLAMLAAGLFVVRPVFMGMRSMYRSRDQMRPNPKEFALFVGLITAAIVLLCVPWSSRSVYPCFVGSQKVQKLTVPLHTIVRDVFIREGAPVRQGDLLFRLDTSLLRLKLSQKEVLRATIEKEIQLLLLDDKWMSKAESKQAELRLANEEIRMLKEELQLAQDSIIAPFDAVVTNLDARFQNGFQPGEGVVVGELQSPSDCVVHALIPATDIDKVRNGQEVDIWLPAGTGKHLRERIDSIRSYSEVDLRNSPFSSRFGGELATEAKGESQHDAPLEAQFDCSVNIVDQKDAMLLGMTGRMAVPSPPRSIVARFIDNVVKTFNRELLL